MRSSAVCLAFLTSFLAFSSTSALAQEAQPFTNTTGEGVRVTSGDQEGTPGFSMRADGDAGTAKAHVHQDAGDVTPSTQLFHGRLAGAYDVNEVFTAFASVYSAYTSLDSKQFIHAQASQYVDRVNPYHNWGDVAAGGRWHPAQSGDLRYGAEGGAMFYGAADGLFSSPNFGATSPFVRGLLTWSRDRLRVNANGGFFFDQSFQVWKSVFEDPANSQLKGTRTSASQIYPEERQLLGIYGKKGSVLRLIGGANIGYDFSAVHPFLETSFEETDGALVARLAPGVSFSLPKQKLHVLFAVELAPLPGDAKVVPLEPSVSAHAGLALELGRGTRGISRNPNPTPNPTPLPTNVANPPLRRPTLSVEVMTDEGKPVRDAHLTAIEQNGANRSVPQPTDESGHATFEEGASPVSFVRADSQEYFMVFAARAPFTPGHVLMVSRAQSEQITLEFRDEKGNDLPPGTVKIWTIWGRANQRSQRTLMSQSATYVDRVPATPGQDWKLQIENASNARNPLVIDLNQPLGQLAKRFLWDATGARWVEVPMPMVIANVFDADLADVKPASVQELANRLRDPALKAQITCALKVVGDPSFGESLAKARGDALVAWLKAHGVKESQLAPVKIELKTEVDSVRVEFTR